MNKDNQSHGDSNDTTASKSDTAATGRSSNDEKTSGSRPEILGASITSTKQRDPRPASDLTSTDGSATSVVSRPDESQDDFDRRYLLDLARSMTGPSGNHSKGDRLFLQYLAGGLGAIKPASQGDRPEDGDVSKEG